MMENSKDRLCPVFLAVFFVVVLMDLLMLAHTVYAEIIPSSRRIDWANAGYPGSIPEFSQIVNVKDFGAKGNGVTDDYQAIANAIAAAPSNTVIFVPQGTYRITHTITMKQNTVLRGAGAGKTRLKFDLGAADCIRIEAWQRGEFTPVVSGFQKGSKSITVKNGSLFKAGDVAEIQQDNDAEIMYTSPSWNTSWAQNAVGQFFRIVGVSGNTLQIDRPLHIDFRADLNPQVRTNSLIQNVGVEDLYIERSSAAGAGYTIWIANARNCWIRSIESAYTYKGHVIIYSSMNVEIRDSYFHHSHDYGTGGDGYGIQLFYHTTDCLVENNVFDTLRHSVVMNVGANGNVFAYNYSAHAFIEPNFVQADVSLHGHYLFMNLFEGNIVQKITMADWWGPLGPGNTLLRNRVEFKNIEVQDYSHSQNIVGNELTGGSNSISIHPSVIGTLVHGNNENGGITWSKDIVDHNLPRSYYLSSKPSFFGQVAWPPFGPEKVLGEGTIPAKVRFDSGAPVYDERGAVKPPSRLRIMIE